MIAKPEITIDLTTQSIETRGGMSPFSPDLSKPVSSKAKLKHMVATNPLSKNKTPKGSSNNSITKQKASLDKGGKDFYSRKPNQTGEYYLSDKVCETSKVDTKNNQNPKYKSFFKDNSTKPKALQISTTYTLQGSRDMSGDFKASSTKNASCVENCSPQQKMFGSENKTYLTGIKLSQPQSVKNSQSQTLDTTCSRTPSSAMNTNKRLSQHPHHLSFTEFNLRNLPMQNNNLAKRLSPCKLKSREDRASVNGLLASKVLEKRRSSSRNGRFTTTQFSETIDDQMSKLSTKAPSQTSEVRRSFPSQKSASTNKQFENPESESKDVSSSLKSSQTVERKNSAKPRTKTPGKDANYNPILDRKAKSNAMILLSPTDMHLNTRASVGNIYKTDLKKSEFKKNSGTERVGKIATDILKEGEKLSNLIKPALSSQNTLSTKNKTEPVSLTDDKDLFDSAKSMKDMLKVMGSRGLDFGDPNDLFDEREEEDINSLSCISHHEAPVETINYYSVGSREFRRNELLKAKAAAEQALMERSESVGQVQDFQRSLSNIKEGSLKQNTSISPKGKFFRLRKQAQEKRAMRKTRSFEGNKIIRRKEHKGLRMSENFEFFKGVNTSPVHKGEQKNLQGMFKKTKQILQTYQEKEKGWMQEKQALVTRIQTLEQIVESKDKR